MSRLCVSDRDSVRYSGRLYMQIAAIVNNWNRLSYFIYLEARFAVHCRAQALIYFNVMPSKWHNVPCMYPRYTKPLQSYFPLGISQLRFASQSDGMHSPVAAG